MKMLHNKIVACWVLLLSPGVSALAEKADVGLSAEATFAMLEEKGKNVL
jgi:hypothetical protein